MKKLDGCVALITGAGRGIGAAMALRYAREGATVVVVDLDEANATLWPSKFVSWGPWPMRS